MNKIYNVLLSGMVWSIAGAFVGFIMAVGIQIISLEIYDHEGALLCVRLMSFPAMIAGLAVAAIKEWHL